MGWKKKEQQISFTKKSCFFKKIIIKFLKCKYTAKWSLNKEIQSELIKNREKIVQGFTFLRIELYI